jgi:tetratricopeptide (TPR) repeat protein
MRSKLIRRLLVLAVGFTLLLGGAGGFYFYRKARINRQYAEYKTQGLAAAAQGKNQQAVDLLQLYLTRKPDDVDALIAYVRARPLVPLPNNQHIANTIYVLRHLLKLPEGDKIVAQKRQLLDLYVQMHYWTEAELLAEKLLPDGVARTKEDLPIASAHTFALSAQKEFAKALVWARQWSALAPTDLQAQLILLRLANQTRDFSGLAMPPADGKVPEIMRVANGLADVCERNLSAPAGHGPPATGPALVDARPSMIRANGLLLSGKNENVVEARKQLRKAAGQSMDGPTAAELVRELDVIGDPADSLPVLKQMARENPQPLVDQALACRSWEVQDWETVVSATDQLRPSDPKVSSELLALRAGALVRVDRKADAASILKALADRPNDSVAAAWAFILNRGNAMPDLKQLSKRCSEAADHSAYLRFYLAEVEVALDEPELAIADYQKAGHQNLTWVMPPTRLSELLANAGRYEEALQAGSEAFRRKSNHYPAVLAMCRAWELCIQNGLRHNGEELANQLAEWRPAAPPDGQFLCLQVDVLSAEHKPDAEKILREGLKAEEKTLTQMSLLQLAAISRKYRLGVDLDQRCLNLCQERFGISADLAYARAANEWAGGDADRGARLFESARASAKQADSIQWKMAWAKYLDLALPGDPRAAKAIVRLADDNPGNLQVQLIALTAQSTSQDAQFTGRTIDCVKKLMGESGVAWRLARARWLLKFGASRDANSVPQARNLLDQVVNADPGQPEAHWLLSRCNEHDGRIAEAIGEMRLATNLRPGAPGVSLELVSLLEVHGDFDTARDELSRLRVMNLTEKDRVRAAELAALAGDPKLAVTLTPEDSAQSNDFNNSGQLLRAGMLWSSGDPAGAETICQRLLKQKPDAAVIRFAAELYASQGRLDEATRKLALLDQVKLDPGIKQLMLADFAGRYVSQDLALKHLEQAISEAPKNPQVWKQMIAFRLARGQVAEAMAVIEQACQTLPNDSGLKALRDQRQLLSFAATDSSLRPLVQAFVGNPTASDGQRILSSVVHDVEAKPTADALADQVKALAEQHPQSLSLWMYAIECCFKANRVEDAKAIAIRAAAQFPASPEPQKLYVGLLLGPLGGSLLPDPVKWQEVLSAAQKWRDRTMGQPIEADILIAQADIELNRPNDALNQLDPYVRSAQPASKAYQPAILPIYSRASQLLDRSGALAAMEPLLSLGPTGRQAWMSFAVRYLDVHEAAAWLDRAEKAIPPQAIAERVALAQVWSSFAADRQYSEGFARALAILEPLAHQTDPQEPYLLVCAVAEEQSGRFEDAEAHYRQALKLAPRDVVVINNLAMLLTRGGRNLHEALSLAQSAISLRPDIASFFDTLASVQGNMGSYPQGIASARQAIEMQPQNLQFRATLADLQFRHGDRADAKQTLRDLDSLHPDPAHTPAGLNRQIDEIRAKLGDQQAQAN